MKGVRKREKSGLEEEIREEIREKDGVDERSERERERGEVGER